LVLLVTGMSLAATILATAMLMVALALCGGDSRAGARLIR